MTALTREQKMELGELLALGHKKFGRVALRLPYFEEEDEGGEGGSELLFETHPLLSDLPEGAASDLVGIVDRHNQNIIHDEAYSRREEASPQLQKQPALQHGMSHSSVATLTRP